MGDNFRICDLIKCQGVDPDQGLLEGEEVGAEASQGKGSETTGEGETGMTQGREGEKGRKKEDQTDLDQEIGTERGSVKDPLVAKIKINRITLLQWQHLS